MSDFAAPPLISPEEGVRFAGDSTELYAHLLSLFPGDPSMARLEEALERSDAQDAFLQAHTIKGLAAQLALPALHAKAAAMCNILRARDPNSLLSARAAMSDLFAVYHETLNAIASV